MKKITERRIELRVPLDSYRRWRVTAGVTGLMLSRWIRQTCDEAAVSLHTVDSLKAKVR